jgi:endonuclease V-like protein UPF0215 family
MTHMLRCTQLPRSNVAPKYADPRRFIARVASEIFLTGLQPAFFNNLLVIDIDFGYRKTLPIIKRVTKGGDQKWQKRFQT